MIIEYKGNKYSDGDYILCIIDGSSINGKIHIQNNNRIFICHNDLNKNGTRSPKLFGYSYSWVSILNNNKFTEGVELITSLPGNTEFRKINLDKGLSEFFDYQNIEASWIIGGSKVFKEYDDLSQSKNEGMIVLKNSKSNRSMEIKIGRFIRAVYKDVNINILDTEVETIYNSYVSYTQGSLLEIVKDVTGKEILEYYNSSNYYTKYKSKLSNSCMNNKFEFLELYTQNPKNISLIGIKQLGKVVGRCLIWTKEDGTKLMDRQYTSFDWVDKMFDKIKNEDGYEYAYNSKQTIKLENFIFKKYPYIDSFRYGRLTDGTLSTISDNCTEVYDSTNGTYHTR